MLFSKDKIAVDINRSGLYFASVSKDGSSFKLKRVSSSLFSQPLIQPALKENNILDSELFVNSLKDGYNLLLSAEKSLSVSLPDSVGRVIPLDIEGRFKSRAEAIDMIKWKLKKHLPFESSDTHLDYQQIAVKDNGELSLLVAVISKRVISEYEDIIAKAGLIPNNIAFSSFNLYSAFAPRLEQFENFVFVSFFNSIISIMIFNSGVLTFQRSKELSSAKIDNRLFMELSNSVMAYREKERESEIVKVMALASPDSAEPFCSMLKETFAVEPILLEVKSSIIPSNDAPADQSALFQYSAAIGAAMRGL